MDQIKLCRTCLSDHIPTTSVFSHLEAGELFDNTTYSDFLMRLTSLKVTLFMIYMIYSGINMFPRF